jgi:hypothetical protein
MLDLLSHIREINNKTLAWIAEDPKNRFAGIIEEDVAYWAEQGIHTAEDFELDSRRAEFWDFYKSVHGIRPRHLSVYQWDLETVTKELESLGAEAKVVWEREEAQEKANVAEFEAGLVRLMESGASDRETAIRWYLEGADVTLDSIGNIDSGYICYELNLPYSYKKEFEKVLTSV